MVIYNYCKMSVRPQLTRSNGQSNLGSTGKQGVNIELMNQLREALEEKNFMWNGQGLLLLPNSHYRDKDYNSLLSDDKKDKRRIMNNFISYLDNLSKKHSNEEILAALKQICEELKKLSARLNTEADINRITYKQQFFNVRDVIRTFIKKKYGHKILPGKSDKQINMEQAYLIRLEDKQVVESDNKPSGNVNTGGKKMRNTKNKKRRSQRRKKINTQKNSKPKKQRRRTSKK